MQAQLQQIIEVQTEQNQLLKSQLRWLKASLALLLIVMTCCLASLVHERGIANSKITVVTTEQILEHPISLAENDTSQTRFPEELLAENDAAQFQFGKRITVPPMAKPSSIDFDFPTAVAVPAFGTGRGSHGMCF